MVLSALDPTKMVRAEHPRPETIPSYMKEGYEKGKKAHFIAQLFERAIAGSSTSKQMLALGVPSALDDELFEVWQSYMDAVSKKKATPSPLRAFAGIGEQIWLDGLTYDMLQINEDDFISEFEALVRDHGITGVTTNPRLIELYLDSPKVREKAHRLAAGGLSPKDVYFELIKDLAKEVIDAFDRQKVNGKFSVELNPTKADNVQESVVEAMRWLEISPESMMVKVAANAAGYKIIEEVTYRGGNVNATLIFTPGQYRMVAQAYINGLARRAAEGKRIDNLYSVASFFISRWDTACWQYMPEGHPEYHGMFANSVAIEAYNEVFKDLFLNPEGKFRKELAAKHGAKVQDFLLASTGSKADDIEKEMRKAGVPENVITESKTRYPKGVYVTPAQGRYVVNTLPLSTIKYLMAQEIKPEMTIETNRALAGQIYRAVEANMAAKTAQAGRPGIDIEAKGEELFNAGMDQFKGAFSKIMATIEGIVREEMAKMVNLSPFAGLPIILNGETGELILGEGIVSEPKWLRPLADAGNSIRNPKAITSTNRDRVVYYGYRNVALRENAAIVDKNHLRFDITVLMPGVVAEGADEEFIMTKGHMHPHLMDREGAARVFPEFYEVWNGYAMYVQQGTNPKTNKFEVEVTFARPGDKVLLKPGYSHRTVNVGNEPLVMANWLGEEVGGKTERVEGNDRYDVAKSVEQTVAPSVKPNFSEIEANNGYAYWVMRSRNGGIYFRFNPNYAPMRNLPYGPSMAALRFATPVSEMPELGLSSSEPMYRQAGNKALSDFLRGLVEPEAYKETYERLVKASYTPEGVKSLDRKIHGSLADMNVIAPFPRIEGFSSGQLEWVPGYEGATVRMKGTTSE
ncbi:MAG: transaldolase family protein, partial [Candidatus Omnitrophica bacterium]|nr:transaldolase family protein [Candidatus Omnitrophota bacterium]